MSKRQTGRTPSLPSTFSVAEQVVRSWGGSILPVPTSRKQESDWLAELNGCRLLIEEKMKFDDPVAQTERDDALSANRVHGATIPLTSNNRISGIIQKAAGQLASTGLDVPHDLRIIWFTGMEFDAYAKHMQFLSTIYGSTKVFELDKPGMRECYFFKNSAFFRHPSLDGAVTAYLSGDTVTMRLCLNPFSQNYEALRDSPYAQKFPLGLTDPIAEEKAGTAFIVDTDIDRKDEPAVIDYLEQKYALKRVMNMDMNLASATVAFGK